jgi:ATP-binding cassette subfamily B protein/subfamily B ATP-binding cassette protein MsbA
MMTKEREPTSSLFDMLRYFLRGFEVHAFFLLILSIAIGLVETFNLALLYPMLSEGFGVNTNTIPFYSVFERLGTFLPMGSPFVNYGIIFILMTFFSLLLQLLYSMQSVTFQRDVVVEVKESVFKKMRQNDYRFFVDTKQGDLLAMIGGGPTSVLTIFNILLLFLVDLMVVILVSIMLISLSWQGFVLIIIGGGLYYGVIHIIGKNVAEQLGKLGLASAQAESQAINEFVNGAKAITASNAGDTWEERYLIALQMYWSKFPLSSFIQALPGMLLNSLFYIANAPKRGRKLIKSDAV